MYEDVLQFTKNTLKHYKRKSTVEMPVPQVELHDLCPSTMSTFKIIFTTVSKLAQQKLSLSQVSYNFLICPRCM